MAMARFSDISRTGARVPVRNRGRWRGPASRRSCARAFVIGAIALAALGGCAVQPEPLTPAPYVASRGLSRLPADRGDRLRTAQRFPRPSVSTNRPFSEWGETFPNASCVVALVDRLVHNAEIIAIDGDSYRRKEAEERQKIRRAERRRRRAGKPGDSGPPLNPVFPAASTKRSRSPASFGWKRWRAPSIASAGFRRSCCSTRCDGVDAPI